MQKAAGPILILAGGRVYCRIEDVDVSLFRFRTHCPQCKWFEIVDCKPRTDGLLPRQSIAQHLYDEHREFVRACVRGICEGHCIGAVMPGIGLVHREREDVVTDPQLMPRHVKQEGVPAEYRRRIVEAEIPGGGLICIEVPSLEMRI